MEHKHLYTKTTPVLHKVHVIKHGWFHTDTLDGDARAKLSGRFLILLGKKPLASQISFSFYYVDMNKK
jgi:hypothetical protein